MTDQPPPSPGGGRAPWESNAPLPPLPPIAPVPSEAPAAPTSPAAPAAPDGPPAFPPMFSTVDPALANPTPAVAEDAAAAGLPPSTAQAWAEVSTMSQPSQPRRLSNRPSRSFGGGGLLRIVGLLSVLLTIAIMGFLAVQVMGR